MLHTSKQLAAIWILPQKNNILDMPMTLFLSSHSVYIVTHKPVLVCVS